MKITLVNTFDLYGGAARAAFRLFRGLREIGSDCTMMVANKQSSDPDVVTLKPVSPDEAERVHAEETAIKQEMASYPALREGGFPPFHTERSPFGEVLSHQMPAADVVNLHWVRGFVDYASFFRSQPPDQAVVWTLHDMFAFTGGCHYTAGCRRFTDSCGACPLLNSTDPQDLSFRVLQRKAAVLKTQTRRLHVVAPSRWLADEARSSALFRDIDVSVIPYGLETDIFKPFDKEDVRRQFNLPTDRKIILFAAHVLSDPRKGLALLDDALCRLPSLDGVSLLTVGSSNVALRAPVQRYHLDFIADKAQYESVMSRLYSVADLAAVPSLEDNLPNTALEAMAAGTPVIAFANGGLPDLIRSGATGFLATPGNVESLAQALGEALQDRTRLAVMGQTARTEIEREHSLAVQATRYRDLFQSLVT